jgi:hypothetical protein
MKIRTYPNNYIGITWFYMEEMSVFSGRSSGNIADGQGCYDIERTELNP